MSVAPCASCHLGRSCPSDMLCPSPIGWKRRGSEPGRVKGQRSWAKRPAGRMILVGKLGTVQRQSVVYHACLPSMLIKIVHDPLPRVVGPGAAAMKAVFGITVAGVYCADRPETACNEPLVLASGGPAGRSGYAGAELITKDGAIPAKVILRCIADPNGPLFGST